MPKAKDKVPDKQPIDTWNDFITAMMKARDAWEIHKELAMQRQEVTTIDALGRELPIEALRCLGGTFNRAKFDIALPRLVDYWRRSGGLEALYFPVKDSNFE